MPGPLDHDLGMAVLPSISGPSGLPRQHRGIAASDGRDPAKSLIETVTCGVVVADDVPGVSPGGGQGPGGTMEVPTLTIFCREGYPSATSPIRRTNRWSGRETRPA